MVASFPAVTFGPLHYRNFLKFSENQGDTNLLSDKVLT